MCEFTWQSEATTITNERNVYRQHRCGLNKGHADEHVCRYCGATLDEYADDDHNEF